MKKEKKHNFPDGGNLIFGFKYKCAYIYFIKQGFFYFYFLVAVILLLVKN